MPTTEIANLRRAIGQLRQCISALENQYGDATVVRRLANDLERLHIDAEDLGAAMPAPAPRAADPREVVVVPDTPYDPDLWRGADDEGVGGYHPHHR
ncbi:hypothetical protein BC739_002420 [Kutzneria viridogrisea]|uniref:Uncharacterized protein n=2 Tax=Kutzneria TaxID=43356 RepID=W5WHF8_9PSEU|nr:hypothetical protein [Kutzneria albida]AHI00042.1 hypothetical protein KALB_6683 [Kutzneria albida DSM 43870]MBA8925221.1 hypothetical protein [Kutzneria viridogrisea]